MILKISNWNKGGIEILSGLGVLIGSILLSLNLQFQGTDTEIALVRASLLKISLDEYLSDKVSCTTSKLAACTDPIQLVTSAGAVVLPAAATKFGQLEVHALCNPTDLSLNLKFLNNRGQVIGGSLICP